MPWPLGNAAGRGPQAQSEHHHQAGTVISLMLERWSSGIRGTGKRGWCSSGRRSLSATHSALPNAITGLKSPDAHTRVESQTLLPLSASTVCLRYRYQRALSCFSSLLYLRAVPGCSDGNGPHAAQRFFQVVQEPNQPCVKTHIIRQVTSIHVLCA